MPAWIWIFIIVAGGLFGLKIVYVLCTSAVLPITQGALYVSTSRVRIDAVLEEIPMAPGELLVDLGCGDGRVIRKAVRRNTVRAIGYEVNLMAYLRARLTCFNLKDVQIKWGNFWHADLSRADVVFCYLFPDVMQRLSDKLKSELKPGARIVSCNFRLPGFQSAKILRPGNSLHNDPIFFYRQEQPCR